MISNEILLEILRDACRAPSGDNVQPWRFQWNGSILSVYNIPGVHNPYLDFEERGAYIAHGALIENLCIAAPHYGYETSFDLFSNANEPDLVAIFRFRPCEPHDDVLYPAIHARTTNRRPYEIRPLTPQQRTALEGANAHTGIATRFIYDHASIEHLAWDISAIEEILLRNSALTNELFSHVVWSEQEEHKKKHGLFVKTMEFNLIQEFIFSLASKPMFMRTFRAFGLPRFIACEDARLYATGPVLGGILISNFTPESFIAAGQTLQRVWLTATSLGLALQPLFGTTMLGYKAKQGAAEYLTTAERHTIEIAADSIENAFGGTNNAPTILFRIGNARLPSARTSRKEPIIVYN